MGARSGLGFFIRRGLRVAKPRFDDPRDNRMRGRAPECPPRAPLGWELDRASDSLFGGVSAWRSHASMIRGITGCAGGHRSAPRGPPSDGSSIGPRILYSAESPRGEATLR